MKAYHNAAILAARKSGKIHIGANVNQNLPPSILEDGNTVAWFDFSENITKDENDFVSAWGDKTVNENDLLQATEGKLPKYTDDGIEFDGIDDFIKSVGFTYIQPCEVFIYFKPKTWINGAAIFDGNSLGYCTLQQISSSPEVRAYGGSSSSTIKDFFVDTWHIAKVVFNGVSSKLRANYNSEITGDFGIRNPGGITIGAFGGGTSNANIIVKEAIYRKISDTDSDALDITNYLKTKYATGGINLIAIAGQSNAVGFTDEDILPESWKGEQDNILKYDSSTVFLKMNPLTTGWSAEQSAAHDLLDSTGNRVLLVKSAQSGSPITDFEDGDVLFANLKNGLLRAINTYKVTYKNINKISLLWMQGENEAGNDKTTEYYEPLMRSLISRLRASHEELSNLQIVMSKLPAIQTGYSLAQKAEINDAFANIAADTHNCLVLDTDAIIGLTMKVDNIHYDAASRLLIGGVWANLMLT